MNIHITLSLGVAISFLAVASAEARGTLPRPWVVYPAQAMDSCRTGTAPPQIAVRCDELLGACARELEACVPMRRGGPVVGGHQIALQSTDPACAAAAAREAAKRVK